MMPLFIKCKIFEWLFESN